MERRDFLKSLTALSTLQLPALSAVSTQASAAHNPPVDTPQSKPPHVERHTGQSRVRSGMALGGIGAGYVELRKDGQFYNWSIFNNFPKETGPVFRYPIGQQEDPTPSILFFKVRYQVEGEEPRIKLLQLVDGIQEGALLGIASIFPWMQAVAQIDYSARFPFATLTFTDPEMPFEIRLKAWSPFIPHDVKNSSLPIAYFDFEIVPTGRKKVDVMLVMTARNTVGYDTPDRYYTTSITQNGDAKTVVMSCEMDKTASTWGQLAITSTAPGSTHYTGWSILHPYYEYVIRNPSLPNLDDTDGTSSLGTVPDWMPATQGRNIVSPKTGRKTVHTDGDSDPCIYSSLATSFALTPGAREQRSFILTWNFPNLYAESAPNRRGPRIEGHFYSNFFSSVAEVSSYAIEQRSTLLQRSQKFQEAFFDSSIPVEILEQVNSQLNTFVTSGRLVRNGNFGVQEGLAASWSWGPVATMDVMLYGTAPIIALFPELQKATMRCHARIQSPEGEVAHGLLKSFDTSEDGTNGVSHRLDLPGQFVIMALRDYFWTNDLDYLRALYPHIQRAIDYIVHHRSFAGDSIPIMRGIECSYDNFPMYGYAAYLVSQWICALTGAVVAAEAMNDPDSKARYQSILNTARQTMETRLWNGSCYRLYNDEEGSGKHGGVSEAILTDQIVGQWMAHQSGLGHLLQPERIRSSLKSILAANYKPGFGLRNCSSPGYPFLSPVPSDIWNDQANTLWSGVELAFASLLLYEGFPDEAASIVQTVDDRYRKNGLYWNHQEFGGHYFRPMSAWAILNGYLGLGINGERITFDPRLKETHYRLFLATSTGTARYTATPGTVTLRCLTGNIAFRSIHIRGKWAGRATLAGRSVPLVATPPTTPDGFTIWQFERTLALNPEQALTLS